MSYLSVIVSPNDGALDMNRRKILQNERNCSTAGSHLLTMPSPVAWGIPLYSQSLFRIPAQTPVCFIYSYL